MQDKLPMNGLRKTNIPFQVTCSAVYLCVTFRVDVLALLDRLAVYVLFSLLWGLLAGLCFSWFWLLLKPP